MASLIDNVRQRLANAEATSKRGGMRPPVTDAPIPNGIGGVGDLGGKLFTGSQSTPSTPVPTLGAQSNQRNQAAAGTAGTTLGDSSGTGVNTPSAQTATKVEDIGATLQRNALGTGPTQSFKAPQNDPSTYSFSNNVGGTGSITSATNPFTDAQRSSLDETIRFNAQQSTKDMFARDAADNAARAKIGQTSPNDKLESELTAKLRSELNQPFIRRGVVKDLQDAVLGLRSQKADAETSATKVQLAQDALASKLGTAGTKNIADTQKQNLTKTKEFNKFLLGADGKNLNPAERLTVAKGIFGDTLDSGTLRTSIGADLLSELSADKGDLNKQVPKLMKLGFQEEDAAAILNDINAE